MIKAVIFDWGGVLIENPTEGILRYCREVLGIGTGCMLAAYRKLIPYLQEGKISEEEFWKGVRRRTGAKGQMPPSLWLEAFEHSYVEKEDVFAVARALHGCYGARGRVTMGLGTGEIILITFLVVLLFGASRLPKLGSELGRAIGSLRRALGGAKEIEASVKEAGDAAADPKREESAIPTDKA